MASGDLFNMEICNVTDVLRNIMPNEVFQLEIPNFGDEYTTAINKEDGSVSKLQARNLESEYFENTSKKEDFKNLGQTNNDVLYEKMSSTKCMKYLQIGIGNSIGSITSTPDRDILMKDFMAVESTNFTYFEPNDKRFEFIFKTYAPQAFGYFRSLFGIKSEDFVASLCDAPSVELPNPGSSGSVFYISHEDKFITKTVQQKEALFLQKLLPGYFLNLNQNPDTLLPKFFGLYSYNCDSKNIRMIVMNNILPYSATIQQKYDLKGSRFMRKASENERKRHCPTYKDLDFLEHHPGGLLLGHGDYAKLMKTLHRDVRVLESFQIMDYSLLIGITFNQIRTDDNKKQLELKENCMEKEENLPKGDNDDRDQNDSTTQQTENKYQSYCSLTNSLNGIPAKLGSGEDVLIYVGIIDILQSYRLKKKLEHVWKSIFHDGDEVSVHNPKFYAKRFLDFLLKFVFKAMPQSPKYDKRKLVKQNK